MLAVVLSDRSATLNRLSTEFWILNLKKNKTGRAASDCVGRSKTSRWDSYLYQERSSFSSKKVIFFCLKLFSSVTYVAKWHQSMIMYTWIKISISQWIKNFSMSCHLCFLSFYLSSAHKAQKHCMLWLSLNSVKKLFALSPNW